MRKWLIIFVAVFSVSIWILMAQETPSGFSGMAQIVLPNNTQPCYVFAAARFEGVPRGFQISLFGDHLNRIKRSVVIANVRIVATGFGTADFGIPELISLEFYPSDPAIRHYIRLLAGTSNTSTRQVSVIEEADIVKILVEEPPGKRQP